MRVTGRLDPKVVAAVTQNPEVTKAVRQVARDIQRDARRMAPRRTGRLRRSIRVVRDYDRRTRRVEYRVGWDRSIAFYGWIVESGGESTPPRPHLRPAAIKHGAR